MQKLFFSCLLLIGFLNPHFELNASNGDTSNYSIHLDSLDISFREDHPIIANMDALLAKPFKESRYHNPKNDQIASLCDTCSLPIFSDSVIAHRLFLLDQQTPFALSFNAQVKAFINLYAYKKRELSGRVLGLSELYFPLFETILDQHNLPLEFKYLAVVESALNPTVKSKAGAVGLWQFMFYTGKMFGLEVTSYVDERMDPIKSTHAACNYFKHLYNIYGNWELVMAAYNCGPGNVNKAIRKSGGKRDFWEIYPYLPRETRGYVPAFIAVNYVLHHAESYKLTPYTPMIRFAEYDTVHVKGELKFEQIANAIDVELAMIETLNPQYKSSVIPYSQTPQVLRLPTEKTALFVLNKEYVETFRIPADVTQLKHYYTLTEKEEIHVVRSGEYLGKIASNYNVSVNQLMAWNNLKSSNLKVGQRLVVKQKVEIIPDHSDDSETAEGDVTEFEYYNIKDGDSLWEISKSQGISLEELKELNSEIDIKNLKPGDTIKVAKRG